MTAPDTTDTTGKTTTGSPLKVHHLRPAPGAKKAKQRVGRGEASKGKTAGRGTKGTKARYQVPAAFEGGQMPLHMRLPKLKGFTNRFRTEYQVVNLDRIASLFPQGGTIGVDDLVAAGAVRGDSLDKVLQEACRIVADALETDLAKVLEIQPEMQELLVKAGIGWKPGIVGGFKKHQKHTALADIVESIEELRYYREHFIKL